MELTLVKMILYDMKMTTRECNKCGKEKLTKKFRDGKKTCIKCEYRFTQRLLRSLVKERKLSPLERIGQRLGYMGSAFIMLSPYLIAYDNVGYITYCIGALLSIPQVWLNKSWNLVVINLNLLLGYGPRIFI